MTGIKSDLDSWIDRNVKDFCDNEDLATDEGTMHCAHFVCHVIDFRRLTKKGRLGHFERGVPGLAKACTNAYSIDSSGIVGDTKSKPLGLKLIYVTNGTLEIKDQKVRRIQRDRHVGFYLNDTVWHYENESGIEKVVSYKLGAGGSGGKTFVDRYRGTCKMCITDVPTGCSVRSFVNA